MAKTSAPKPMGFERIGKCIDQAWAAQPHRGAPSFEDVKVAILAAFAAGETPPISPPPDDPEAKA